MRPHRLFILITLAWVCANAAQADVTSIADWPCQEWQARRQAGTRLDPPQMWLSGFMTGLATARDVDVLAFTNGPALFKAMDAFCIAHPEQDLSAGGLEIFQQILHRLPTTPPRAL